MVLWLQENLKSEEVENKNNEVTEDHDKIHKTTIEDFIVIILVSVTVLVMMTKPIW